jgi:hypothetical protein
MNILYVAPYPHDTSNNQGSPGAARKISLTVQLLEELGHNVTLLNSSNHNNSKKIFVNGTRKNIKFGNVSIEMIVPFMFFNKTIGKLVHLFFVNRILSNIIKSLNVDFVLIYNAYLFEVFTSRFLQKKYKISYIAQIEDLPWARKRGFANIKARIETNLFKRVCQEAAMIMCVSKKVLKEITQYNRNTILYPPVIDDKVIINGQKRNYPFSNKIINIGIFGGLNREKGAHKAIELVSRLDDTFMINVAGIGPLSCEFKQLEKENNSNFKYYGYISDDDYVSLLSKMDILINPHVELTMLSDGVFPFKIFEYIAAGAYVISTSLPDDEKMLLNGLCIYNGTTDDLVNKILNAKEDFNANSYEELRKRVIDLASFKSLLNKMRQPIENIGS